MTVTHQTVKTLVTPGNGGLPGPDGGPVPLTEAVPLQCLVEAAEQQFTLHLEVISKRPESLPGPGSGLGILICQTKSQGILYSLVAGLEV